MDKLFINVALDTKLVQTQKIDKEKITIGRERDNDIYINNLAISRHHAEITNDGGKLFLKDLESSNGTYLNGVKINYAEIRSGDAISIGKYILSIESKAPAIDNAYSEGNTVLVDQSTQDKFLRKLDNVKIPELNRDSVSRLLMSNKSEVPIDDDYFTIGSDINAHLNLSGFFIKEKHAMIVRRKDGKHTIISSGSFFSPTKVNGKRVDEKTLTTGDIIQIGRNKMIYVR